MHRVRNRETDNCKKLESQYVQILLFFRTFLGSSFRSVVIDFLSPVLLKFGVPQLFLTILLL